MKQRQSHENEGEWEVEGDLSTRRRDFKVNHVATVTSRMTETVL